MGTRSLTHFIDNGKTFCTMYRQYDGYPSGLGQDLKDFLQGYSIVNGYSSPDKVANGMGCLAAQVIAHLKDGVGNVYIYPPDASDCWEEYTYYLSNSEGSIHLKINSGDSTIYDGLLDAFDPDKVEND